jgi:hypothetical protein
MERGRFYQQFGERNDQPERELVPSSLDSIEADLHAMLERQRAYSEIKGWYFTPSKYMYGQLLQRSVDLFQSEVPEGVIVETVELLAGKMALAVGILAYPQWRSKDQMELREGLQELGFIRYCEEAEQDINQWYDEDYHHDHYVRLPEQGRQLLKHIANVTGIPYNPKQDTFFFSTVLKQPEPNGTEGS